VRLPPEIVNGFAFDEHDPQWKAIHMLLDASIESETSDALSKENKSEDRAWHSGRASSLIAFKQIILSTREQVLADIGRAPQKHDSSENGTKSEVI
jgi:hypothetical protein